MASHWNLRLISKEKVASNAWSFIFERPHGFTFLPGQYIRIFDPIIGESVFRDFTIASSPLEQDRLLVIIKEGISIYKKNLFTVEIGQKISMLASMGKFYLDENEKSPLVFLAGGVGITPFYSMMTDAAKKHLSRSMTLIVSFSSPEDSLFSYQLELYMQQQSNLKTIFTFSKNAPKDWIGEKGRISEDLIKKYIIDMDKQKFLISGSPSFVSDMENVLTKMNVNLDQIRTEIFLGFN